MTDDELIAEVEGFLAQGGRGEFEELGDLRLTIFRFNRTMPVLNASGNARYAPFRCEVVNTFGRPAATNWSTGAISAAPSVSLSVRESPAHTA
jgi:hypothetical protein